MIAVLIAAAVACDDGGASPPPSSPVRGVLTGVQTSPGGDAERVTLEDDDGNAYEFRVEFEAGAGFPAAHLEEHRSGRLPVRISFRRDGDDLIAFRIDDG